jgi:hypothetical protein
MLLPRFTIRTAFLGVTVSAVVFVVVGIAFRGDNWAWGITIGLVSLAVTAVHAALVRHCRCTRLPSAQTCRPAACQRATSRAAAERKSKVQRIEVRGRKLILRRHQPAANSRGLAFAGAEPIHSRSRAGPDAGRAAFCWSVRRLPRSSQRKPGSSAARCSSKTGSVIQMPSQPFQSQERADVKLDTRWANMYGHDQVTVTSPGTPTKVD